MKPVLILQHQHADGPSYLATWLARAGRPFELRNTEAGDDFPASIEAYGGLAILGGAMGANDELPSLRQAERLIVQSVDRGRPVIGHCLGGQLMARALGATVTASPRPEIGWQPLEIRDTPAARAWFGGAGPMHVYHWHHDAFALPRGAEWLAASQACPVQAFALGPHLAMQFHVEIDAEKAERWSHDRDERYLACLHEPTVQAGEAMRADTARRLAAQQALADRLYARWAGAFPV